MKRSFTLIELLASLAIIGMILSIAILNISSLYIEDESRELDSFVSDLNYARKLAISSKEDVSFEFIDRRTYRLKNSREFREVKLKTLSFNEASSASYVDLFFKSKGRVSQGCTFILDGSDKSYEVTVVPVTGKITLKEGK